MEHPWGSSGRESDTHGAPMGVEWPGVGHPLGTYSSRVVSGIPMGHPWVTHGGRVAGSGTPMGHPWQSSGREWDTHGASMAVEW